MKLLLNGKKRSIYFRKNNTAYYKSKGSEIDKTNYFKKKGGLKKQYVNLLVEKKLVGGVSKEITFNSNEIFTNPISINKSNIGNYTSSSKIWNTDTIKDIYQKLLYVFIICKLNYNINKKLFKDIFKYDNTPNATIKIKKIIRILNGDIFKLYVKDITSFKKTRFSTKKDQCGKEYIELNIDSSMAFNIDSQNRNKDTIDLADDYYITIINKVEFKDIAEKITSINLFELKGNIDLSSYYKNPLTLKITSENESKNLDLLKIIMINERLFEKLDTELTKDEILNTDTRYCERNDYLQKMRNKYLEMFNHKEIQLTDEEKPYIDAIAIEKNKTEKEKFTKIWDENSKDVVSLEDNQSLYTLEYKELLQERKKNGTYYKNLINILINKISESKSIDDNVKNNNMEKLKILIETVIIKSSSSEYLLLNAYNEYLDFHIGEIEQTIGRVLTTYLSIRNNDFSEGNTQINEVITGQNKRKTVKFGGKNYTGFNEIFGTITAEKITQTDTNLEKFNKMTTLFNKLATSNLAILVFGYGYSGSGKTYTLFGERATATAPIAVTGGVRGALKSNEDDRNLPRGARRLLPPGSAARSRKRSRTPVPTRISKTPKPETLGIVQLLIEHLIDKYKSTITIECIYELYNDNYNILNALSGTRNPYDNLTKGEDIYTFIPNINKRIVDEEFPIMDKFYNPTKIYMEKSYKLGNINDTSEKPSDSLYVYSEKVTHSTRIIEMNGPLAIDQFQDKKHKFETADIKKDFNKIYEKINTFRIQNNRIMPTANNPTSSRGHLFIDLKIETTIDDKTFTSYLTICDMGGRENPNDLLLGTKIYNILHNESTTGKFEQKVYRPHIISKDEKTMYSFIRKDKDIIPQIPIKDDEITKKLLSIINLQIKERDDEYPGILQLYKSFYTAPTIVEFFYLNNQTDFKLNQQLGSIGNTNQQNIKGMFSNFGATNKDNMTKFVNFYKNFFKCIKQGFYINDSINQLLLKFGCDNSNNTLPPLTFIANTGSNKESCNTDNLKVVKYDPKKTLKKPSVRRTAVEKGFNEYGWYVNSLPKECIETTVFRGAVKIRNGTIYRNSYLQYDPNKISKASHLENTNIGIAKLYSSFGTEDNIVRKYVVIGCIRDSDKFIDDDKISLKFLNTVSTSKLTDDVYSNSSENLPIESDEDIGKTTLPDGFKDDDEDEHNMEAESIRYKREEIIESQTEYKNEHLDEDRISVVSNDNFEKDADRLEDGEFI